MTAIPIFIAFFACIVSFLSPCILPIIPGFLAYLAGESSSSAAKPSRLDIFLNSFFFVLGFSIVFALLGVLLNSVLVHVAYAVQSWLAWIGGTIVIFFGLYLMGFFRIRFFESDHKVAMKMKFKSRYLTSLLFGLAFAAGWTPCVGPVLGGILGIAASAPGAAFFLLLAYAIGLGIPFSARRTVRRAKRRFDKQIRQRLDLCESRLRRDPRRSRHPCFHAGPSAHRELRFSERHFPECTRRCPV